MTAPTNSGGWMAIKGSTASLFNHLEDNHITKYEQWKAPNQRETDKHINHIMVQNWIEVVSLSPSEML